MTDVTFASLGLSEPLLRALTAENYTHPTPIQAQAIPAILEGRDVLGLDDPLSDNIAANLIGLVLGLTARFALFRTFVFKRPISIIEIYDEPGLPDETPAPDGDAGSVNESDAVVRSESMIGPFRAPRAPCVPTRASSG